MAFWVMKERFGRSAIKKKNNHKKNQGRVRGGEGYKRGCLRGGTQRLVPASLYKWFTRGRDTRTAQNVPWKRAFYNELLEQRSDNNVSRKFVGYSRLFCPGPCKGRGKRKNLERQGGDVIVSLPSTHSGYPTEQGKNLHPVKERCILPHGGACYQERHLSRSRINGIGELGTEMNTRRNLLRAYVICPFQSSPNKSSGCGGG